MSIPSKTLLVKIHFCCSTVHEYWIKEYGGTLTGTQAIVEEKPLLTDE